MTDGHSDSPADATPAVSSDSTAAPVPADVRPSANHHVDPPAHELKEQDSIGRLTPRPTFMEHLVDSRDAMFHLNRRDSSELERYFVSCGPGGSHGYNMEAVLTDRYSTVPVIWTSTPSGLSSCVCMVVSCQK